MRVNMIETEIFLYPDPLSEKPQTNHLDINITKDQIGNEELLFLEIFLKLNMQISYFH